jgi:hypothetical protein
VLGSHDFQHNFTAYVHYDIMICQHWVNNLSDFNLGIFHHCLGLVKSEADSTIASCIASLEAQVTRGNLFRASSSSKPVPPVPTSE